LVAGPAHAAINAIFLIVSVAPSGGSTRRQQAGRAAIGLRDKV
jgi:hypothetical protein